MIRVPGDTQLTLDNVRSWIAYFKKTDMANLQENQDFYLNSDNKELPYAKKLVTIASAATIGDGITVGMPDGFTEKQKAMYERIMDLFKRQIISAEDLDVITLGSIYGWAYEITYMSNDENPVPKCKALSPLNAFVVFDDTVEENSLFGIYFNEFTDGKSYYVEVYIYDDKYKYTYRYKNKLSEFGTIGRRRYYTGDLRKCADVFYDPIENTIGDKAPEYRDLKIEEHKIDRMPITMYRNNNDLQGDFEQVKPAIIARNKLNDFAMDDAETIANNIVVLKGNEFSGETATEKKRTLTKVMKTKALEINQGDDAYILTKQETFSMISVFGQDLNNKIYDLSMIIDFSSEEFSGNLTGVALRLKLFPFKRLVKNKDYSIEKLYRRRIKMYMNALESASFEVFDVGLLEITINRTWEENILELAQTIATLYSTGLFSDEYLINKMPDGEYEVELTRKQNEAESGMANNTAVPSTENSNSGNYNALLRELLNGNTG